MLLAALVSFFPAASTAQAGVVTSLQLVITPFIEGLSINVPIAGSFPSLESPDETTTLTVQIAPVSVTDTRRSLLLNRAWTANAIMTNLVSGSDTLTADTIGYSAGAGTMLFGLAGLTEYTRLSMHTAARVATAASATGNHAASWRPTLNIPIPPLKATGTYVGVLTHSVF